jgi:hypothetical protein
MSTRPFAQFLSGSRSIFNVFGVSASVWLASGMIMGGLLNVAAGDTPAANQIFEKVLENYSSFSSYSDEGQIITATDGDVAATRFTVRLARPNFYKIEWQRNSQSSPSTEDSAASAVWSSGAGNYLQVGWGVEGPINRDTALANAAALSEGAAATIPGLFFSTQVPLEEPTWNEKRLTDEKLGDIDCYVLVRESQFGETKTFWIGKQDFLIHQVRTVVSAKAMQVALAKAAKGSPEIAGSLHGFISTETHTNIILNQQFSRSDFVPSFPLFQQWIDE